MLVNPPPDIRLSVSIMVAPWDDQRVQWATAAYNQLVHSLPDQHVIYHEVDDSEPTVFDSACACWREGLDLDTTHHLVMQDDVVLCDDFVPAFTSALSMVPNRIVTPFDPTDATYQAFRENQHWYRRTNFPWGQGICLPHGWIGEYLEWAEGFWPDDNTHDDASMGAFNALEKECYTWCTVPSLVQHVGADESILGNNPPIDRHAGVYIENTSLDPLDIDWSFGSMDDVPVSSQGLRNIRYKWLETIGMGDSL